MLSSVGKLALTIVDIMIGKLPLDFSGMLNVTIKTLVSRGESIKVIEGTC